MKFFILLQILLSFNAFSAEVTAVECGTSIDGKIETMKIKINSNGELVFWNSNAFVKTTKNSYFSFLTSVEDFGYEGGSTYFTSNGYSAMSVSNTAETIDIGVHKDLTKGYYNYRDGGSGNGNERLALKCNPISL